MESNPTKIVLILTLLSTHLVGGIANTFLTDLLSKELVDKNSLLQLFQVLFTAKLLKDYQDAHPHHALPNDPETNYMLFLGKGNIQFQNHQLDVQNTTDPTDYETTGASTDLAHNKHLLKFVARNGVDVWKRLQMVPHNSSHQQLAASPTYVSPSFTDSSDMINDLYEESTHSSHYELKPIKTKYDHKFVNSLKELYKPDLQMIETEEGFIKHDVKPPKWVQDIIYSGSPKGSRPSKYMKTMANNKYIRVDRPKTMRKAKKKAIDKSGYVESDDRLQTKYINNKNINNNVVISSHKKKRGQAVRPTLQTINKKQNKVNEEKHNNRIGNIVIKGFNGLIRGIGSMIGIDSSQE